MARKGQEERCARRGVQGVSSSAWLEIKKVPGGKVPGCVGIVVGVFVAVVGVAVIPVDGVGVAFSSELKGKREEGERDAGKMEGTRTISWRFEAMLLGNADQVLRRRASKPQPG